MNSNKRAIVTVGKIIDLLNENGYDIKTPYDVENFAEDYLRNHSFLFKTGKFNNIDDEDEEFYT